MKSEADDGAAQRVDFFPVAEQRAVGHLQTLRGEGLVLRDHVGDFLDVELFDGLLQVAEQWSQDRRNGGYVLQSLDPAEQSCFGRRRVH